VVKIERRKGRERGDRQMDEEQDVGKKGHT